MPSADNTPSVAVDRPYTHEMVIVHRVFRREAALMPRLVHAVPTGGSAPMPTPMRHRFLLGTAL
ncbi:hypothetical protein [Nonomuraea aurantiaca]|uniref:hypothetical protein n=1 Tax=Nonomuraea aurantiaca TaxID=2878562 RepID=UPI001CD9FEFC|nr:hypothetical protein [Nonomuraea aurantiaca]MCA2227769.1 hypothetical protein [Nonomuraea aurantiaca]